MIAEQVEAGGAADVEQSEWCSLSRGHGSERGTDHRGPAHLVGVHLLGAEQFEQGVTVLEAQIDEQRPRIGRGLPGVDGRQWMVETAEQQVVDGGEEQQRVVPARRRFRHEVQDLVALGNHPADAVIQRGVTAARRVGDVQPYRGEIAHIPFDSAPHCPVEHRVAVVRPSSPCAPTIPPSGRPRSPSAV